MTLLELLIGSCWMLVALIAASQMPAVLPYWFGVERLPLQLLGSLLALAIAVTPVPLWLHTMRRNGTAQARRSGVDRPTPEKRAHMPQPNQIANEPLFIFYPELFDHPTQWEQICITPKAYWDAHQHLEDTGEEYPEITALLSPLGVDQVMESTYSGNDPIADTIAALAVLDADPRFLRISTHID